MTEPQTPGYWTFHAFAPIDEVATALLLAGIDYDALSQAATLRPGASEGREEAPHEEDFDTESTVVFTQEWTDTNRPDMPVPGEWVFEPERDWSVEWRKGIEPVEQDTGRCHWVQLVPVGRRDALSTGAADGEQMGSPYETGSKRVGQRACSPQRLPGGQVCGG